MPEFDLSAADQCVMCGMCQPHCPTYQVQHIESESPRGRLSMIQGLAQKQLEADQSILTHLYNCTGCGACETVCPSRVPFTRLLDNTKYQLRSKTKRSLVIKTLLTLTKAPARLPLLNYLLNNRPLGWLFRRAHLLPTDSYWLQQVAKQQPQAFRNYYPARSEARGNIALFTGCISRLFDQQTLQDSIRLLTHAGYNVHIPARQACCGALHQHQGELETANKLTQQNTSVFDQLQYDAIVSTSTGCTAQLTKNGWKRPVLDIMTFIQQQHLLDNIKLQPLNNKVSLHTPCSQHTLLNERDLVHLLKQIPALTVTPLGSNQTCCGAGGTQLLAPTSSTAPLRQIKVDEITAKLPDFLISTNYGCALHIAAGLTKQAYSQGLTQNKEIEVIHPVSLLVKSASLK